MTDEQTRSEENTSPEGLLQTPPTNFRGILRHLGPGLIIAGSIVGSGELIATTKTGAEAGFWLLWLIVIGCVIKVFVQIEMGRYTVVNGKTTMDGLNEVPGPRIQGRGNWIVWFWVLVFLATIGQQGGIVGGVGQALQVSFPLTEGGRKFNAQVESETQYKVAVAELDLARRRADAGHVESRERLEKLTAAVQQLGGQVVDSRLSAAEEQLASMRQRQDTATRDDDSQLEQAYIIAKARTESHEKRPELVFDVSDLHASPVELREALSGLGKRDSRDDEWWALVMAAATSLLLVIGRYGFIQSFSAVMVASFTLLTIINLAMLQASQYWAVGIGDLADGLSFRIPPAQPDAGKAVGVATALAAFGIIGVGANELLAYPYWCLEKGYAHFTGPRDKTSAWASRALGWMRVMRWDAWCSMVVYTFATVTFYLLGAAVLWRTGLNPEGGDMIRTLSVMYEPVFGSVARWVFLFGAFAVLYSTLFVAAASLARIFSDAVRVMGIGPKDDAGYRRWVRVVSGVFPFVSLTVYVAFPEPAGLVLIGGLMQGIMLPMLAGAALYFRYRRSDLRIMPGLLWDLFLWVSALGMLLTGSWTVWTKLSGYLGW